MKRPLKNVNKRDAFDCFKSMKDSTRFHDTLRAAPDAKLLDTLFFVLFESLTAKRL